MAQERRQKEELTGEERRERRAQRREKQRKENLGRAAKMHKARLNKEAFKEDKKNAQPPQKAAYVGCSGWFYWKWRGLFYNSDLPTGKWFDHYIKHFDTVEINASFYSWPTVTNVKAWKRQAGRRKFTYTVKVCELITHVKKFRGTKTLINDFGVIADILGDRMGCFLFQLPPSYRFSKARLASILNQLDPSRRNVVEFRHRSWWNEDVYAAFRATRTIFCCCSGPRLPDELIKTADDVYVRLHGPERWYRHHYSDEELRKWRDRIEESGALRAWIYFNNDNDANAPKNAQTMRRLLAHWNRSRRSRDNLAVPRVAA